VVPVMRHRVEIELDDFGWEALNEEACRQGVSIQELLTHAAMYYLAGSDDDLAHRVPRAEPDSSMT
jgi:hypothetical protein